MACTNTNPCDQTSVSTSATGKKISQLNPMYQLSANDLFVVVDVNADGPNTADITKNIEYGVVIYYENDGTNLSANTFQDAITELDRAILDISASTNIIDVTDSNTYLKTQGAWTQSDVFDDDMYYSITEVDGILEDYTTIVDFDSHTTDSTIHYPISAIDHGELLGLLDNDHPQYAMSDDLESHVNSASIHFTVDSIEGLVPPGGTDGYILTKNSNSDYDYVWAENESIDDVVDSNTYVRSQGIWVQSDIFTSANYYTSATVDTLLDDKVDNTDFNSHVNSASIHFTEASIDHGSIQGLLDNDHPQYATSASIIPLYGDTASIPSDVLIGTVYFNTDLGYPIWFNGSNWVNATGAVIIGPS